MGHKPEMTKKKAALYKRLAEQQQPKVCDRCEGTGVLRGYHGEPCPPEFHEDAPCHHCNGSGKKQQSAAPPMTDREAEAMAQQLWGDDGRAWHPCYTRAKDIRYCCIGKAIGDTRDEWKVYGHGEDWERAFADAKARGH